MGEKRYLCAMCFMRYTYGMSLWTPRFLETDAFGLDISDRSFKYAMMSKGEHGPAVAGFGKGEFPEGVIVGGEIKNEEVAAEHLAHTIRAAKLSTNRVIMALPEEKGFLRRIELPADTDPNKIRSALELHIEEHVPLTTEEMIFDYERLDSREVIATVFPRAIVERYIALAHRAGLEVVALETEAHALFRAAVPRDEKRPVMVIDLGETRAGFLIADEGVVASTATKPIGGTAMIDAIQRATGSSHDEAIRFFYEEGLLPARPATAGQSGGPDHHNDVFGALLPLVAALRDEVAKHIAFWQTHRLQPVSIYLTGGITHMEGLPEYLAYELRIPVSRAALAENLFVLNEYIPPINRHDTLLWAAALGLAARNICLGEQHCV